MWKIVGNIIEMFIYASVYMIISIIAVKIVAASLSPGSERHVSDNNIAFGLIFAAVFVGLAIVLSTIVR